MLTVKGIVHKRLAIKGIFILAIVAGAIGLCLLSIQLYRPQYLPPPGYHDWFSPSDWDANSISRFLGVRVPPDAIDIQIQGRQGLEGSYGVSPQLQFSFRAPPQSAMAFITAFCNGDLYSGYNPLTSTDSALPSSDTVLIRGAGTLHYSRSLGVPTTTSGNRCARQGWLEEIVIDKSASDLYTVSYRLPYQANVNPAEYYPTAQYVTSLGNNFRLYVTGLRNEKSEAGTLSFTLSYPIICLETGPLALVYDYWAFNPETLTQFQGAAVTIRVDGTTQPSARITDYGSLLALPNKNSSDVPSPSIRWNYCLTTHWKIGSHSIQFIVTPRRGPTRVFEWTVSVQPTVLI